MEWFANCCLVMYNLLKELPFGTWGEMTFVLAQCKIQIFLFWTYTEGLTLGGRLTGMLLLAVAFTATWFKLPTEYYYILGAIPTVMTVFSRLPQIIQNFQQGHTGQLSFLTWFLSMVGNAVRVITTIGMAFDYVNLMGHVVALVFNILLCSQILLFAKKTAEVTGEKKVDTKKTK